MKHIDRYLSELEWRFNNRDNPHIFVDTLSQSPRTPPRGMSPLNNRDNPHIFVDTLRRVVATGAVPYAELIADAA